MASMPWLRACHKNVGYISRGRQVVLTDMRLFVINILPKTHYIGAQSARYTTLYICINLLLEIYRVEPFRLNTQRRNG